MVVLIIVQIRTYINAISILIRKAVKDEKRKNKTACANWLFDVWIVGDCKKIWNCFSKSFADVINLQRVGDLKPDMFENVYKENFVASTINGRAQNNYVNDRAKTLKE